TQVAAAARNIELLHESGNSNKRDRDGIRVQNRGQGQQEIKGHYDQGYDSKRQDFRGQDQRSTGRNGNDRQGQGSSGQRRSTETLPPSPLCATCGKPYPGVCYKDTGGCFTCGSTQHKAAKTLGTITGILCIDDRTVFALFDTGATHSIISTTFSKKLNINPTPLIERIIISTPMKNHTLIDHEY
nr:reverse transcriptase domain-containing protein [Tanacetum cinerariifolium]